LLIYPICSHHNSVPGDGRNLSAQAVYAVQNRPARKSADHFQNTFGYCGLRLIRRRTNMVSSTGIGMAGKRG
jgi:hypothetical protein